MRRIALAVAVSMALVDASAAAVLCAKLRKGGLFNGAVKIRQACKPGETQLEPEDVGFCCGGSPSTSTTVTTTTGSCPTFTMTSLGIPDCGGNPPSCFGLCANARQCEPNAEQTACGCTGPEQPCGVVTYNGQCGGPCPFGQSCQYYGAPLPNGCTEEPHSTCRPDL